jgi:DNA repair protein RadD
MELKLRPYQEEALTKLFEYWENNKGLSPIVVLPTGAGKGLVISSFCERVCKESPGVRILVVTHIRELVDQNRKELLKYWPGANTGIYSAGMNRRDTSNQILFCGIQSIYNKVFDLGKIDIVIVDESQMIPRDEDTRYGKFFKDIKMANPRTCIWSCTATPFRLDSGLLHEGEGALFDGIAYSADIKQLIDDGYLVPAISKGGIMKINLEGVHLQAGDYKPNELAMAADDPALIKSAVSEIVEYGHYRKSWLVYCCGVLHAEHVAEEIRVWGISCEIVTGDTPKEERDRIVEEFKAGKIRCIVNVMVLTTGFNVPRCDLIALLFATKSAGKYVQCVGRGLRTSPETEKEDCLILDFGGNVSEFGPIDQVNPIVRKNILGEPIKAPPMRECPNCHTMLHISVVICPECEYEFPSSELNHGGTAYEGEVISGQPVIITVTDMWVTRHKKQGKPDSVKITFFDKMSKEYSMWLALDHGGYATDKALPIVRQFGGKAKTVDEALQEWPYWKKPIKISIKQDGKFTRIVGIKFPTDTTKQTKFGVTP